MDYPWIMHGYSMDHPWIIDGLCMDNLWTIMDYQWIIRYPWIIHGLSMASPWIIHGESMDYLQIILRISAQGSIFLFFELPWQGICFLLQHFLIQ